ncbi:molybdenum cofactor biosynthesis protein MoaE [Anderseniella sp. Alg231-50]|uniref:molybdenum cofactor biosynthesis protein MoaE n=1 Tax=Anderseniella sp. Alg231-50 TaxID=1922226 RepID=UPI000D5500CA
MIRVQEEPFDIAAELHAIRSGNHKIGGTALFAGSVRDLNLGEQVSAMTLEHYPGMTEKALAGIEAEANERWPLDASLIVHRYGRMQPGEDIVLVITCSSHREAAFEACQFLMDWLKTRAPFWKLEEGGDTEAAKWVDARESDDKAADRWSREEK